MSVQLQLASSIQKQNGIHELVLHNVGISRLQSSQCNGSLTQYMKSYGSLGGQIVISSFLFFTFRFLFFTFPFLFFTFQFFVLNVLIFTSSFAFRSRFRFSFCPFPFLFLTFWFSLRHFAFWFWFWFWLLSTSSLSLSYVVNLIEYFECLTPQSVKTDRQGKLLT